MKRSKFSLSNYKLLSMNMGFLTPIGLLEVLPGDSIQHATSALVRCAPLVAPVMHPVHCAIHHWYVPHRLVWDEWEDFITGGPDGMDDSAFPVINSPASTGFAVGSLADFLGVPPAVPDVPVSALPFRGYNLIWNEYYRDQDLATPAVVSTGSGVDSTTNRDLLNGAWEKDYYTSSRPWRQKGPSVTIPLGTEAPVLGIGVGNSDWSAFSNVGVLETEGAATYAQAKLIGDSQANRNVFVEHGTGDNPNIRTDLANASAVTVNLLREALALQRYEEARARYGSRYTEYLRYLGVRSSDARLQRPEYLGGGKQTIQFSEVLATAESAETPIGALKGHGIAATRSNRYRRFIEEHGYIISMMIVRPKTIYSQGLTRTWLRRSKEDFWQQEFQHIGQQEVYKREVWAGAAGDAIFGYQDRYDEYRRSESMIAGEFRTTELDYWHMARIFAAEPALNASFVQCVPTNRNFAATDEDKLYVMANHSIQARRLVARTGKSYIY